MKLTLTREQVIMTVPCATCLAGRGEPCIILIGWPKGGALDFPHTNRRIWAQRVVNRRRWIEDFTLGVSVIAIMICLAIIAAILLGPVVGELLDVHFPVWKIEPTPEITDYQLETL